MAYPDAMDMSRNEARATLSGAPTAAEAPATDLYAATMPPGGAVADEADVAQGDDSEDGGVARGCGWCERARPRPPSTY